MNGSFRKMRVEWKMSVFRQDHSKDEAAQIPKYDGFCTMPSHTNYRHNVNNFYNLYKPITHIPAEGDFQHICSLVEHIFGEQYELGMDYLQLLYLKPTQKLPILLLVSEERNTGKSTFLNFLKAMFQENVTFNTNEDFRSQFNADWAGKLMIVVDEVLLNLCEDSERLKNLSTAHSYKMEAKGKTAMKYSSSPSSCYVPTTRISLFTLSRRKHVIGPAPNALSYFTYQISVLPRQKYSASSKKVGRFYTVTREKLKDYR